MKAEKGKTTLEGGTLKSRERMEGFITGIYEWKDAWAN